MILSLRGAFLSRFQIVKEGHAMKDFIKAAAIRAVKIIAQ